jgi:hypothetical protein
VILTITIASVLALLVPIVGALVWLTFGTRAHLLQLATEMARLASETSSRFARLEAETRQKSPTALAARLEDLNAAVDSLAASQRKQFGRVWGTLGAERAAPNGHDRDAIDPELQALLALQTAPTPK